MSYPLQKLTIDQAEHEQLGSEREGNKRTINRYVYKDGIKSCQLMFGITILEPNSLWNTMPVHLHDRRMEVYLYFDMPDEARVFHLLGEPHETRHLVVKNQEAVISAPWSIHSGVGTSNYTFIWAMAGENYSFSDQDFVKMDELR
jgi:4-deoxy-L-threo-5-hexosulose-uronate ketol-isomerase